MVGGRKINKRSGPDTLVKMIQFFSVMTWLLVIALLIIFSLAKPRFKGFGKGMSAVSGSSWNTGYLDIIPVILVFNAAVCLIGIIINASRMKRKSDKYNKSLIFFGVISIIGIILYSIM